MTDEGQDRSAISVHEPVATVCRQIRRSLRTLLSGWGITDDVVDDALLVVEELITNVIDHARTRFQLAVQLTGRVLHLAVRDCGLGLPELRAFDPDAARGRGLQVIAKLGERWAGDTHERGKTVWVDLTA